jgi:hypothetical protein
MKRIAALTTVRNGERFLERWLSHYGAAFGLSNLYVILDGHDQKIPAGYPDVNAISIDHVPHARSKGDKIRAARASDLARDLLNDYDIVIGTDVDEFLVVDPRAKTPLDVYLSQIEITGCLSAMGLDVVRHDTDEVPLDWAAPFLGQRRYSIISDRYTKANILKKPLRWGSGFHRVRHHGFRIDPQLVLFHFGSVDPQEARARLEDTDRKSDGWTAHQMRRINVSDEITSSTPRDGDDVFDDARAALSRPRSLIAWNKPRPLRGDRVVTIPDRFHGIV